MKFNCVSATLNCCHCELKMTSTEKTAKEAQSPWYASYPAPKIEARGISREEVLGLLMDGEKVAGKDFVLVDLRRNDHEVGIAYMSCQLSFVGAKLKLTDVRRAVPSMDPSTYQPRACGRPFPLCTSFSRRQEYSRSFGTAVGFPWTQLSCISSAL